jgi:hypothetical protein
LIIDEAAFISNVEEIWISAQQTLATGGQCMALSTPNGVGNWFHQTYIDAESATNDFHPIKLHWTAHPQRDQDWFEKETRNMSKREIESGFFCFYL